MDICVYRFLILLPLLYTLVHKSNRLYLLSQLLFLRIMNFNYLLAIYNKDKTSESFFLINSFGLFIHNGLLIFRSVFVAWIRKCSLQTPEWLQLFVLLSVCSSNDQRGRQHRVLLGDPELPRRHSLGPRHSYLCPFSQRCLSRYMNDLPC